MLSIDYSSSDEEDIDSKTSTKPSDGSFDGQIHNKLDNESIVNPFDANNYDLSSSEEEVEECDKNREIKVSEIIANCNEPNERRLDSSVENPIQSKVSIFSNPFKEEEAKQLSHLERHVKLTDNKTISCNSDDKKSKTICWSYHKHKKCRFGNRCRFRHNDEDFIDIKTIRKSDDSDKKRIGITDSLIPPKRAMKAYYSQQKI